MKKLLSNKIAFGVSILLLYVVTGCSIAPKKMIQHEINTIIEQDRQKLYQDQELIGKELGIGDVMARALRYNLQYRTERLTQAVMQGQFELAKYDMLPTLAAEAGFVSRSNVNAARSVSIFTNNETLEPSTSQDKNRELAKLKFSWNILDFGVSYFEAKQNADKSIIANNVRQKMLNSILQETYSAYWNYLMAQELSPKVAQVIRGANTAILNIDQGLKAQSYSSPIDALKLKKKLYQSIKELDVISQLLQRSGTVLRNLINVPSKKEIVLKSFNKKDDFLMSSIPRKTLELTALANSLDLQDRIYSARIEQLETRKAIARLFPGIEINYSNNYDSNSFAHNDHWGDVGLQVSFNLMKLASTSRTLKNAHVRKALEEQKRLAISMAVVTQFNLAMNQLEAAKRQMAYSQIIKDIDHDIYLMTNHQAKSFKSVVEKVQTQVAALQTHMGYKSMQTSVREANGAVFFTLGLSPIPAQYQQMTLPRLAQEIELNLSQWYSGNFPIYQEPAESGVQLGQSSK